MPIMDGTEACKIIVDRRGEDVSPKVVFVTAHALSSFELMAMSAGADGFISKPFNLSIIRDHLLKLFDEPEDRSTPIPPTPPPATSSS